MKAGRLPSFSSTDLLPNGLNTEAWADCIAAGIDTAPPNLCCKSADSPETAVAPKVNVAKEAAPRTRHLRNPTRRERRFCPSSSIFSCSGDGGVEAESVDSSLSAVAACAVARRRQRLSIAEHVCCCARLLVVWAVPAAAEAVRHADAHLGGANAWVLWMAPKARVAATSTHPVGFMVSAGTRE